MWTQTWGTIRGQRRLAGWLALLALWAALAVLVDMSMRANFGRNVKAAATPERPSAATSALGDGDDVRVRFLVRVPDATPVAP